MNGKQLPCVFVRMLAVLSEFVPIALPTFGLEIPHIFSLARHFPQPGFSQAQ